MTHYSFSGGCFGQFQGERGFGFDLWVVDLGIFHWISKHVDLMVALDGKSSMCTKIITMHLKGSMNIDTKFKFNPSNGC